MGRNRAFRDLLFGVSKNSGGGASGLVTSGLIVQLDGTQPASMTLTGSRLDQWNDLSGNGNNFGTGFAGNGFNPTYNAALFGGRGGVNFAGGGAQQFTQSLAAVPALIQNNFTMMWVATKKAVNTIFFLSDYTHTRALAGYAQGNRFGIDENTQSPYGVPFNSPAIVGFSSNGTVGYGYLNGKKYPMLVQTSLNSAATASGSLEIGGFEPATANTANMDLAGVYIYNRVLSDAEVLQNSNYFATYFGINTIIPLNANIVFDGNSITAGHNAYVTPYPYVSMSGSGLLETDYTNWGYSGRTTQQMTTAAPTNIDPLYNAGLLAKKNVVIAFEITNDIVNNSLTATQAYNNYVTYCQARKSAGWKVVAMTVLPRTQSGFDTIRLSVNSSIRTNFATFADALADVGGDATIGATGADTNTTYYQDGLHPTDAGHNIMGGIVKTAVLSIIT